MPVAELASRIHRHQSYQYFTINYFWVLFSVDTAMEGRETDATCTFEAAGPGERIEFGFRQPDCRKSGSADADSISALRKVASAVIICRICASTTH